MAVKCLAIKLQTKQKLSWSSSEFKKWAADSIAIVSQ